VLYIQSKALWGTNRGLQITLRNAGVTEGVPVTIARTGTWGFDSGITGVYQQIAIPITQFAVIQGVVIDQVRIADFGGAIGFYIDDISFQGGASSQPATGLTQELGDARYRRLSVPLNLASSSDVTGVLPLANVAALPGTIGCTFDGGGVALTSGKVRYVLVPYAHTITGAYLLADVAGTATVDIWRDTFASYPPVVGDSITAGTPPVLAGTTSSVNTALTGWGVSGAANTVYAFSLTAVGTVSVLQAQLTVTRT